MICWLLRSIGVLSLPIRGDYIVNEKTVTTSFLTRLRPALCLLCSYLMVGYSSTSWSQTTNTLQLTWDASTDSRIDGYYVYSGTAHGTYSKKVWVGNVTNTTISGLTAGVTYYYAATALSRDGLESIFSNELIYGTPSSVH